MDQIEFLSRTFELECDRTRQVLAVVPDELLDFSPGEGLHSVRWNVSHLVNIPTWTELILRADGLDVAPVDGPAESTPEIESMTQALTMWDAGVKAAAEVIATTDAATLSDPWKLEAGGQELETLPRLITFNQWVITHIAHHRGHLLVSLRLKGIDAPHIYG